MSAEERKKILQMLADGKIGADEAALLMNALNEENGADDASAEFDAMTNETSQLPELDEIRKWARRVSLFILVSGIGVSALSAWIMSVIQKNYGVNFWFVFFCLPLIFGVTLIVWSIGGWTRGLYLKVRSKKKDDLTNIVIALPLPLGIIEWFFRAFGGQIKGLQTDKIADFLSAAKYAKDPIIVHVDDKDESVQVFIG
ncbi:MAG: hypothetical protein LC099_00065 [Anaerolineales bacterium]|nr:hypothetical protein [Anaerolineales bacterium]